VEAPTLRCMNDFRMPPEREHAVELFELFLKPLKSPRMTSSDRTMTT
jgi:hypothetical protein